MKNKFIFIGIFALLLLVGAVNVFGAVGTVYFNDTFEVSNPIDTQYPAYLEDGWSDCTYSTTIVHDGSQSLKCANIGGAYRNITTVQYPATVEVWFYYDGTSGTTSALHFGSKAYNGVSGALVGDRSGSSTTNWYIGLPDTNSGVAKNGVGWYLLTMNLTSATNTSFYVNNTYVGSTSSSTIGKVVGMYSYYATGRYFDNLLIYNWTNGSTPAPPTFVNGLSFVSQVPTNLTAFSLFSQNFNVTYNFTNQTTALSGVGLNYSLSSSQSCLMFVNGSCMYQNNTLTSVSATSSVVSGNSTLASFVLGENSLYPSTAIRNSTFFNQNHSVFSMTGNNDFFAFKLLNVSNTSRSNLLELMINDTAISRIYLCNSSISLAGALDPLTNLNCQEIGSIDSIGFNHTHGSYSGHNIVPFSIVNGQVGGSGIIVTNSMWIMARGNSLGVVRIGYVNNGSLSTSVYSTANGGNTWTDQSASVTVDAYLHQYGGTETLLYYAYGSFNGTRNVSANVSEFIDVPPLNPSPATITVPFNTVQSSRYLNITYLNATANTFGSSIVKYNITLLNENLTYDRTIVSDNGLNNSYLYDLYAQNLSIAKYYVRVYAFDNLNNSASDEESFNLTRNAVLNITAYDKVTNVSISNLNLNITDQSTNISESWNTTGSLLNVDIVKSHLYSIDFDVSGYAYESATYTANTSFIQKLNQSLTKTNSVTINVFDESSLALITNVTGGGSMNITFISDAGSTTYNTTTGYLFVSNITAGTYEVKFNAPLYAQRSYYLTITNRSTQTLNAYLSQSTINLLLTYVNKETGELIENVGVNVYKIINGSWTAVATGFTDITGRWQVSVTTNTNYRFSSTITGYDDKTFNLNPVIFTAYTIQLTKQQSSSTQLDFSNINVYILNTTFTNNGSNSFSWQISAPSGNLEQYAYSLSTQCKNISSFSGVNAFGGINVNTFNLSCASILDHVTLKYNYTLTGGEIRSFTYTYSIIGSSLDGSFMANNNEHYGMGLFERILIVVLITIVMAGLITKFSNIVAGLGAGLLIMSYMSYIGFIEWWLIAPTLLVGFVLISSWSTSR